MPTTLLSVASCQFDIAKNASESHVASTLLENIFCVLWGRIEKTDGAQMGLGPKGMTYKGMTSFLVRIKQ